MRFTRVEAMGGGDADADARGVRRGHEAARFMCNSCRKTLTNTTRMTHLRQCGHVVCFTCAQTFVATVRVVVAFVCVVHNYYLRVIFV